MKFGQFMEYYQRNFFMNKFHEKNGLETSSKLCLSLKESCKKESKKVSVLVWTR